MSAEFVDTNIFLYAHELDAGSKHERSMELLSRLVEEKSGAISTQVLCEFYSAATKKLHIASQEAAEIVEDLGTWTIHRPDHADLLSAMKAHRHYRISWWDALIVRSAQALGCSVLWTEDLSHGRRYGSVTVRNPFRL